MIFDNKSRKSKPEESAYSDYSILTMTQLDILRTEAQKEEFNGQEKVSKKAWFALGILLTI